MPDFARLPAFDVDSGHLHVVIETPKGSRNKFAWDDDLGLFRLKGVLKEGMYFPTILGSCRAPAAAEAPPPGNTLHPTPPTT